VANTSSQVGSRKKPPEPLRKKRNHVDRASRGGTMAGPACGEDEGTQGTPRSSAAASSAPAPAFLLRAVPPPPAALLPHLSFRRSPSFILSFVSSFVSSRIFLGTPEGGAEVWRMRVGPLANVVWPHERGCRGALPVGSSSTGARAVAATPFAVGAASPAAAAGVPRRLLAFVARVLLETLK
jgi:hypothetical protein